MSYLGRIEIQAAPPHQEHLDVSPVAHTQYYPQVANWQDSLTGGTRRPCGATNKFARSVPG